MSTPEPKPFEFYYDDRIFYVDSYDYNAGSYPTWGWRIFNNGANAAVLGENWVWPELIYIGSLTHSGTTRAHEDLDGQVNEDLSYNLIAGDVADPSGTAIAGIIGAKDDGAGVIGIAPNATLLIGAFDYPAPGWPPSEVSEGYVGWVGTYGHDMIAILMCRTNEAYDSSYGGYTQSVISWLNSHFNLPVIVPVGSPEDALYWSKYEGVIGVGGTGMYFSKVWPDERYFTSAYGDYVDFVGPGYGIMSPHPEALDYWYPASGTDMAAAFVAAQFAVLRKRYPTRTVAELVEIARATAINNTTYYNNKCPEDLQTIRDPWHGYGFMTVGGPIEWDSEQEKDPSLLYEGVSSGQIHKKSDTLLYIPFDGEQGDELFYDISPYSRFVYFYDSDTKAPPYVDKEVLHEGNSCGNFTTEDGSSLPTIYCESLDYAGDVTVEYYIKMKRNSTLSSVDYRMILRQLSPGATFSIHYGQREAWEASFYPGSYIIFSIGSQAWYMSYVNYALVNPLYSSYETVDFEIPTDQDWEHHALQVNGEYISFYKDGKLMCRQDGCVTVPTLTEILQIGGYDSVGYWIGSWIDDFIITAGAKYDSNFEVVTPPPLPSTLPTPVMGKLSLSLEYAIASNDIYWLSNYLYRYRITIDRTKFFMDRDNYYLPLLICNDVGANRVDISGIFDVVAYAQRKCIAITLSDKVTEVPVIIKVWNQDSQIASVYAKVSKVWNMDWHADTVIYFYYGSNDWVDNPNVTDA